MLPITFFHVPAGNRFRNTDALTAFGNQWRPDKVWFYFWFSGCFGLEGVSYLQ